MNRGALAVTLLITAALALGVLGPASARTRAAPKYGGTLVVGLRQDPGTLDPTLSASSAATTVFWTMCLRLYERDARQELVPLLAAAVPTISKDKLGYTIQLRKGIQFNDGTPFDAQAVVTTVQRFITYPGSTQAVGYANVDSVSASGPYTVVFRMKTRDSTFEGNPYVLSPTQIDRLGANVATKPVCVGPFMFDDQVVGDRVTVIKSPYWYDRKNVYLDKIVYRSLPNAVAAAAALKAGDIQALAGVSTTELDGVRESSGLRVIQAPQLGWQGIAINIGNRNGTGNLPYANIGTPLASSAKLRQAFEEAIDRDTMNKVVYAGLVQVSCTPVAPANPLWYEATKVPCTPYDPKHAKKLVAESGVSNPTVRLLTADTTDRVRLAQFIQAQEAAVGINVVIDTLDANAATTVAMNGHFDASVRGFAPGNVDPHISIFPYVASSGVRNFSGYSNPRLDLILANGLKATSTKARSTLYRVAQQIIQADRPIIYLHNNITFAGFSTNLVGVELNSTGTLLVANARFK